MTTGQSGFVAGRCKRARMTLLAASLLAIFATPALAASLSNASVRQAIVRESIANYPGSCPCPNNVTRNGSPCWQLSAYSRPGG